MFAPGSTFFNPFSHQAEQVMLIFLPMNNFDQQARGVFPTTLNPRKTFEKSWSALSPGPPAPQATALITRLSPNEI